MVNHDDFRPGRAEDPGLLRRRHRRHKAVFGGRQGGSVHQVQHGRIDRGLAHHVPGDHRLMVHGLVEEQPLAGEELSGGQVQHRTHVAAGGIRGQILEISRD